MTRSAVNVPGTGSSPIDTVDVPGAGGVGTNDRQVVALGGDVGDDIAKVSNTQPSPSDYGVAVRPIDTQYAVRVDTSVANTLYIGQAVPGTSSASAGWQIKKLDTSSGIVTTWADGDANFDNVWNNRASLTYS